MARIFHNWTLLVTLFMATLAIPVAAQTAEPQPVTGVVICAPDWEPVIGASVMLKGTRIGAATDYDGRFSLKAPLGSTLEISFVGMETTEVKVDGLSLYILMMPRKFWNGWVCFGGVQEGLFGHVYDRFGGYLSGATVLVLPSGRSTTTDDKGDFNLMPDAGDTLLRVEHPYYEPRQGQIDGNCFDISLDPLLVRGQVVDENGEPIIAAKVKVKDGDGTVIHTDLDGCFSYWIGIGRTVEVSYPGYKSREVETDCCTPMTIALEIDGNAPLPEFISCPQPTRKPLSKETPPVNIQD
ncbi:MAG: carboxypeptidase-like regulatory domain-containing protein [Muribaculaceae bacterium]|nr:carboxypeptidase-like regulatory domain-containing protein [Muribaculaceae bacterium]